MSMLFACTAAWAQSPGSDKKETQTTQTPKKQKKRLAKHHKNPTPTLRAQLLNQSLDTRQFSSLGPAFASDAAENCRAYANAARLDPMPDHDNLGAADSVAAIATRDPDPVPTGASGAKIQAPVKANGPVKPSGFQLPITQRLNLNLELNLAREVRSVSELQINDVAARTGLMYRF